MRNVGYVLAVLVGGVIAYFSIPEPPCPECDTRPLAHELILNETYLIVTIADSEFISTLDTTVFTKPPCCVDCIPGFPYLCCHPCFPSFSIFPEFPIDEHHIDSTIFSVAEHCVLCERNFSWINDSTFEYKLGYKLIQ